MARVQERFRLERPPLGAGAFGLVHLAYDTELDRQVAIKIPHDEDKERALRHEAKLMARIQDLHEPHVVSLYDLHELGGRRVIVMEYVEGQSLRGKLGKIGEQRPLELDETLNIAIQACLGLHTLHKAFRESGIFHRDIKPENILIRNADGMVKIADFGIATVLASSGLASTTAGTLPYMAPELLEGDGADFRADIYALGVTVYEMLTGRMPFSPFDGQGRPKAPLTYGREICRGHPATPADVVGVDRELSDIVIRAIDCDVNQRCQSAQELREALEAFYARYSVADAISAARKETDPVVRERLLQDILRRFPRNPEGYRNLAWFYNSQSRFPEAVKSLEEGAIHCPKCGGLLFDLALGYHRTGQIQRAIDTMEEARRQALPPDVQGRAALLLKTWRRGV
jgi:eukaryotic-like serine/threonine-protein kinase